MTALSPPLLHLENICKRYPSGDHSVTVLNNVSLTVHAGEFVAIMGSSGSGKSTLMHLLGCLDQPSSGDYWISGQLVSGFRPSQLAWLRREMFGFVFQSYHLISTASAWENVALPAIYAGHSTSYRRQRAEQLLARLGLQERLHHKPNQLSGGQQQRVSIARALMNGGNVILADEPTGALDRASGDAVMEELKSLSKEGHTIILITHDRDVASHADRIIELRDGCIVADVQQRPHRAGAASAPTPFTNDASWSSAREVGESVLMALRALKANWLRTSLTLLGIVIGVAAVVAMLAIGQGAKEDVVARIDDMGSNLVTIRPQRASRSEGGESAALHADDAVALQQLPYVLAAVPEVSSVVTARGAGRDVSTTVRAVSPEFPLLRNWFPHDGVFFNDHDARRYAAVAVLGHTVQRDLFAEADALGQFVMLNNVPFQVIGVMPPQGATSWGDDQDDAIFIPLSTGQLRLMGQRPLRTITLAIADPARMAETEEHARALLVQRHGRDDFRVFNMASLLETVSATQNTLTILLGSIAAISLLVGGIGVMNIMLVSVTERIHEIGIRMATGARQRNILQQFLTESVVVSALGGVIGVALGIAVGVVLRAFEVPILFSIPVMVLAFMSASLIGLVFGFAPALKASRLNPVEALNND